MKVFNVSFSFEQEGIAPVTLTGTEGESVLEIALENGIDIQHNCGGVCGCSTCHIYIEQGMENLPEISEKEEDFIDRAVNPRIESRLACQCEIAGNITVRVPDQSQFLGH
jgi:2Fe-2S ferredoxin